MSNLPDLIVDIVALSGGRLVGRTRMQKTAYLLDAKGMKSGAAYYYYNFGPYSDEIADGISDSRFIGSLVEKVSYRQADGSPFSIFETQRSAEGIAALGSLKRSDAIDTLNCLATVSSTVLELAATIHWLISIEKVADWRTELRRRKGTKVDGGRTGKAVDLLTQLKLAAI